MTTSNRVRERAALACQIMACDRASERWVMSTHEAADYTRADRLAADAFYAAATSAVRNPSEQWAEAEALLRSGWSPGDRVRLVGDTDA